MKDSLAENSDDEIDKRPLSPDIQSMAKTSMTLPANKVKGHVRGKRKKLIQINSNGMKKSQK